MSEVENEIFEQRKEKLQWLIARGIEPYGRKYVRTHTMVDCVNAYKESLVVKVAGRVKALRGHGKALFGDIEDKTGKVQFYIKKDMAGDELFELFSRVDMGDVLGLTGELFKTRTGEVTVLIKEFQFLSKTLRPLPEKWHGLKDVELRYRQRYLDLISNADVRQIFKTRSALIRKIREYLDGQGFQEVETPMMQSIPGGAVAKPFKTYHEALNMELYLRIAPELYLKRLLVGGLEKVYELNRNFRNEGISRFHNPEFTMLEVYSAYDDYQDMMNLTENIVLYLCEQVIGKKNVPGGESLELSFEPPWQRLDYFEAIKIHTGLDALNIREPAVEAKRLGVAIDPSWSRLEIINEIFDKCVQEKLIQPTFVIDYPIELCPLSKKKASDPFRAERFELFIKGFEVANAYSELNDPLDQAQRFEEQVRATGKDSDMDFVRALEYGMPCAGGLGIGIDRLIMILTGAENIREVIFFPQLRPEAG